VPKNCYAGAVSIARRGVICECGPQLASRRHGERAKGAHATRKRTRQRIFVPPGRCACNFGTVPLN